VIIRIAFANHHRNVVAPFVFVRIAFANHRRNVVAPFGLIRIAFANHHRNVVAPFVIIRIAFAIHHRNVVAPLAPAIARRIPYENPPWPQFRMKDFGWVACSLRDEFVFESSVCRFDPTFRGNV
jgi:hypothetical protein